MDSRFGDSEPKENNFVTKKKTHISVDTRPNKNESPHPRVNELKIRPNLYKKKTKRSCFKQVQQVSFHGGMMDDFEMDLKSQEPPSSRNYDKILASPIC